MRITSSDRAPLIDYQDQESVHSHGASSTGGNTVSSNKDDKSTSDDMFKTMSMEIQSLLERLNDLNRQLADFSHKNSTNFASSSNGYHQSDHTVAHGSNAAMVHTLQRHRDILQDFQHEFNKIKSNIETQREREDL